MSLIANFDSECGICIGDINEGFHEIELSREDGWVHVECLEDRDDEDDFSFGD